MSASQEVANNSSSHSFGGQGCTPILLCELSNLRLPIKPPTPLRVSRFKLLLTLTLSLILQAKSSPKPHRVYGQKITKTAERTETANRRNFPGASSGQTGSLRVRKINTGLRAFFSRLREPVWSLFDPGIVYTRELMATFQTMVSPPSRATFFS